MLEKQGSREAQAKSCLYIHTKPSNHDLTNLACEDEIAEQNRPLVFEARSTSLTYCSQKSDTQDGWQRASKLTTDASNAGPQEAAAQPLRQSLNQPPLLKKFQIKASSTPPPLRRSSLNSILNLIHSEIALHFKHAHKLSTLSLVPRSHKFQPTYFVSLGVIWSPLR